MADKYLKVRQEAEKLFNEGLSIVEVASRLGMSQPAVRYWKAQHEQVEVPEDVEQLELTVNQQRKIQKLQDSNRIERKGFRAHAREFNAAEELFQQVLEKIDSVEVSCNEVIVTNDNKTGVLIFNDTHIGEVVDLPINQYNLSIARERILTYTKKTLALFKGMGVEKVVVCFLGDLTNAENHTDKLLTNACSRAEALIHAFNVFSEVLLEVSKQVKIEKIYTVMGNEPRLNGELSSLDKVLINNLDYILFELLRNTFKDLSFDDLTSHSIIENVISVQGKKILITHGIWNARDLGALGKRKEFRGADYAICGHIHTPAIQDRCARGGSIVGANSYSYHNLGINSNIKSGLLLVIGDNITPIIVEV